MALAAVPAEPPGQAVPPPPAPPPPVGVTVPAAPKRFDLDFPGGSVGTFIQHIERALGRALNVFVPEEHKDFALPPLKMRQVNVPQLFSALARASRKNETVTAGYTYGPGGKQPQYRNVQTFFGFETAENNPTEDSIWYFVRQDAPEVLPEESTPAVRYWNLERWLDRYNVEDITTAVETGWKLQGLPRTPKLSFHQDTKLLIIAGDERHLTLVDDVLRQLQATPEPKPAPLPPPPRTAPAPQAR